MSGTFAAKINAGVDLLNSAALLKERLTNIRYDYSISEIRNLPHDEQWFFFVESRKFDFMLVDHSLLQFIYKGPEDFSWIYFPCPYLDFKTIQDFLTQEDSRSIEQDYGNVDFLYDAFIGGLTKNPQFSYVRYDYSPDLYTPGRHPAAHLHIGNTEFRIGSKKVFNPLTFVAFVLRQCYSANWHLLIKDDSAHFSSDISTGLRDVDASYFGTLDALEHYLH